MFKYLLLASIVATASPALAQHQGHDMTGMDVPQTQPDKPAQPTQTADPDDPSMPMTGGPMPSALGAYSMTREASGTSWQPDASEHRGIHAAAGGWMLMAHGVLNGVYDRQEGPRGGEKVFVSGMAMGSARRSVGEAGTVQLRAMLSPDPLMGARGYPLLLAAGETANGVTPLVDRQHPHDFFMELSASYSHRLSDGTSLFLYGGLPGEPAFGPPAFMHRLSIMDSPEAPITHHWLDSTHIAFGVVTAGLVAGSVKVEASRFNGREPDQHRWNIETGPLDSTALRVSWNPVRTLSLQASWGRFVAPEQLAPGENQTRWSASAIYTRELPGGWWSTTLAWGRRRAEGRNLDALALESAVRRGRWTLFARAERIETDELILAGGHHGPVYTAGKASLGFVRDLPVSEHLALGAGALAALSFVPRPLRASYGGTPAGFMAFVRLKVE